MGITQSSGIEHNVYWNLNDIIGNKFEDIIYKILLEECRPHLYKDVEIYQTERINDRGKDIIIKFSCEKISLFDIIFYKGENDEAIIYIECKSSNSKDALRWEKFMPSIEKGSKDNIDYYVLLTNSKILPRDYYDVEERLILRNIKFVLIDQYIIAKFLKDNKYEYFGEVPIYKEDPDFFIQYQVYPDVTDDKKYNIFFVFRNYRKDTRMFTISLLSDVNWKTTENTFSFTIDYNCAYSKKISLVCDYETEYNTLVFKVESGNYETFIDVNGINITETYEPPFTGKRHHYVVNSIRSKLLHPKTDKLFCLWGEAGIGKTRIVNILREKIAGGYFDVYEYSLKKDNESAIKEIQKFLIKKEYLSSSIAEKYTDDLLNTILNCNNSIKNAIIFIDDFHNSSMSLIEQIKGLRKHNAPVIIILCGRTDYTEGNTAYYSFVQWTFENLKNKKCIWEVKPFYPKETKHLIKAMINGIPDEALNIISSQSRNNPLYIVQFIEYLLDEKLVYVVNRNTVGILDPVKFKVHDYLPVSISDIYEKRITYLIKEGEEKNRAYLRFLFVLVLFNGKISEKTAENYFDQSGLVTLFLQKRGFISKRDKYYKFYHESLLLYVEKLLFNTNCYKEEMSQYLFNFPDCVLLELPPYTRGRLHLWNKNEKKAFESFEPIISSIKGIHNFSNTDIDNIAYEYLDDILQLFLDKPQYYELAKKTINSKIYMTLHHFVPINAVIECNKCIKYITSSSTMSNDVRLINSLLEQKAHSLLNSGMNLEGEVILKELQAKWLASKANFDSQTVFDMLDRLCAISIKFNCYNMAYDYNQLELKIAKKTKDDSLIAIAYRTRSKLFYLTSLTECKKSLDKVDRLLEDTTYFRIRHNNNIYRAIVDLTYNSSSDYDEIIYRLKELTQISFKKNLNRANIQSNMVLAAAYLKRGSIEDIKEAKKRLLIAIDYSIRFGIPSYMWQLYNLLAIVDTRLEAKSNRVKQDFETAFDILNRQNLLYIGRCELCYSNILAISNIGFFLSKHFAHKTFNERMSMITYCETSVKNEPTELRTKQLSEKELTTLYKNASSKELLFSTSDSVGLLRDDETDYYIALT